MKTVKRIVPARKWTSLCPNDTDHYINGSILYCNIIKRCCYLDVFDGNKYKLSMYGNIFMDKNGTPGDSLFKLLR